MTRIDENTQYILIPKHEVGIELKSRTFFGKELLENIKEEILIDALDTGKCITFKGNDYFVDEKI